MKGGNMSYKIKEIPQEERPRERLKQLGVEHLSNKELLAIILKTGTKNRSVTDLAIEILKKYNLPELKEISLNSLTTIKGIGEVKAIELLAAIELGKRINIQEKIKKNWFSDQFFLAFLDAFALGLCRSAICCFAD